MEGKIVKLFAFGLVLVLILNGTLAFVPATAQAKSDYGLVAEWHFDEGSGGVVKDSSGNGNDGTIHGAKWVDGKYGKALEFDGKDYVDAGRQTELINFGTGDLTVEAWAKSTSTSTDLQAILAYVTTEAVSKDRYVLQITRSDEGINANKIRFGIGEEGQNAILVYSDSVIAGDGQWHHIVGERKSGTLYLYIDSVQQTDTTDCSSVNLGDFANSAFSIGYISYLGYPRYFTGLIDEVRIYNRALTADEIKTHYEGKQPELTLTKSASPSAIQEGETTIISIRIENTGTGDAKSVEVTDTIPTGFKIISGSKSASFDTIKPGDYRISEYTLKATSSGKFTCEPATATYNDADGNSYSAASNSMSIQMGGEVPVGADSDGDGWSDEKEKEMETNPYSVDSDGDGLKDAEDPNPTVPEEKKTPGFEAVFAIVGVLAVAYLLRRRR
jgi:PGF-CTERM protein/uncharacterized repeat protein (TIGR01451 family)